MSEKETKQQFLVDEIIEQNYDPRLFTMFCEQTKEANLDLWTLEELKTCVLEFKEKYKSGQTVEQLQDTGTVYLGGMRKSLSELSSTLNLEIKVSGPKLVDSGFFKSDYAVYTVVTSPFSWEVNREFVDFIWLRQVILDGYPGIFIPPLPNTKNRGDLDERTLIKRQKLLNLFMQCLISHPLIIREEHLRIFLKQANTILFKEYVSSIDSKKLEDLEKFPSLEGKLVGDLIDHSDSIKKLLLYYKKNAEIMKKLKKKAYEIIKDLEEIQAHIEQLIEIIGKLENIQDSLSYTKKYEGLYKAFKQQLMALLQIQKEKIEMVDDHFCVFFRYGQMENESLARFVEYNEGFAVVYRKALLRNVECVEKVREYYAYFNAQNMIETVRVNELRTVNGFSNFYEFSNRQAKIAKDLQESWKTMLESIDNY